MTAVIPGGLSRLARRLRSRSKRPSERAVLISAVLALLLGTGWSILDESVHVEVAAVSIIVVVLASLVLNLRAMLILVVAVALCLTLVIEVGALQPSQLTKSAFAMVFVAALVGLVQARRRDRLGLKQVSAETVLELIRDRLLVQAQPPAMPAGWSVEIRQRPAHGAAISGDFVANRLAGEGESQVLHLAVVDVAGSGITAGPRALLLSGAVGGLLGSVPAEQFLQAANDYLARQHWSLGLASAIYVRLDLATGEYSIRSAGHPPALHYRPRQQAPWRTSPAAGTVLGVLPVLTGVLDQDVLRPGEALFLYTDGVVETRDHDIDAGTQRLKDNIEALARGRNGTDWLAQLLIDRAPSKSHDDRTLVMIQRRNVSQSPRASRTAPKYLRHPRHQAERSTMSASAAQ